MTTNEYIRVLLNDEQGYVFNDKILEPFVELAQSRLPYLAAAMAALSRGSVGYANDLLLLAMPPGFKGNDKP